jgi:hypothetical protein
MSTIPGGSIVLEPRRAVPCRPSEALLSSPPQHNRLRDASTSLSRTDTLPLSHSLTLTQPPSQTQVTASHYSIPSRTRNSPQSEVSPSPSPTETPQNVGCHPCRGVCLQSSVSCVVV